MKLTAAVLLLLALTATVHTKSRRKRFSVQKPVVEDNAGHKRSKRFIGTEDIIGVVGTILELWDSIDERLTNNDINFGDLVNGLGNVSLDFNFVNRKQAFLTEKVIEISRSLDRLEANLAYNVDHTIESILSAMPKILRTELRLHELKNVINQINLQDREMQRYLSNQSAIERHTLENWAEAVSGHHRDSIRNLMSTLHDDVSPSKGTVLPNSISLFKLILQMVSKTKGELATGRSFGITV